MNRSLPVWAACAAALLCACQGGMPGHRPSAETTGKLQPGEVRQIRTAMAPLPGWNADLADAMERAAERNCRVVVNFSSPYCPPCNRMKQDVLGLPGVGAALRDYECVMVDTQADPRLVGQYAISGTPTTLVMEPDGRQVARHVGYLGEAEFLHLVGGAPGPARGRR